MILTTLDDCKAHARLEGTDEDTLLAQYAESAEELVLQMLDRDAASLAEQYGKIPVNVQHAVWMLFAHSYAQREPASMQNLYTVPYTLDALIKPYMNL